MERVTFGTTDGVRIVGDWRPGMFGVASPEGASNGQPLRAVLFLHSMRAPRASWQPLADRLAQDGIASLAIDLRGHGESVITEQVVAQPGIKPLDYRDFTDAEHQGKAKDVEAAVRWLMERGVTPSRLGIVGASIGANLAISQAAANDAIPAVVALSPGLDYRGVRTEDAAAALPRSQKLLLAASSEDEYSFSSARRLAELNANAESQLLADGGHGTEMLERVPGFLEYVAAWIGHNVR